MRFSNGFRQPRHRLHALLAVTGLAFCALAAAAVALPEGAGGKSAAASIANLKETGNAFAAVTRQATPAVVFIKVEKKVTPVASNFKDVPERFNDDMLKRFFGDRFKQFEVPKFDVPKQPWPSTGQASGFIVSKDGYILTNNHVVGGADKIRVTLADGREFDAKLVGADKSSDVAVVKVDADDLPILRMGNSNDLEVGEWVLAVGSPFGLPGTVTSGIVSAKGRSSVGIADYEDFIQTDAAINPGNSGGPLLNLNGEVVGVNTAIASRTGAYNGIGFAIPINMARNISDQLIENGSVTRGFLGIAIQPLTADLAKSFGMNRDAKGVLISDVTNGSPADKAGLRNGDVILEYGGHKVNDIGAFRNRVAASAPESTVKMTVWREGKRKTFDVAIGRLSVKAELAHVKTDEAKPLGLTVEPLTDELAEEHGYAGERGVVVAEVERGSVAAKAGLRPGWLIKEVNRSPVHDVDSFKTAVAKASDKGSVLLHVKSGDYARYITLRIEK